MRTLICTVVGLLATALLICMTPNETFQARGIALPSKHARTPISVNAVSISETPLLVTNYQNLGQVRVEIAFHTMNSATRDALFEKAKSLAASLGANKVVINALIPNDGVSHTLTLMASAYYVPSKTTGANT